MNLLEKKNAVACCFDKYTRGVRTGHGPLWTRLNRVNVSLRCSAGRRCNLRRADFPLVREALTTETAKFGCRHQLSRSNMPRDNCQASKREFSNYPMVDDPNLLILVNT